MLAPTARTMQRKETIALDHYPMSLMRVLELAKVFFLVSRSCLLPSYSLTPLIDRYNEK